MNKTKNIVLLIFIFCNIIFNGYTQTSNFTSEVETNIISTLNNPSSFHKTALRFLNESKRFLISRDWQTAYHLANEGLVYDSTIADLYYIQALSIFEQGGETYRVIELLEKSIYENEVSWHEYSSDSSRLLLAKLYVTVKRAQEALSILMVPSEINNSDAILTKATAYYVLQDYESARKYVFEGARQYPLDRRFDNLFYNQEYQILTANFQEIVLAVNEEVSENIEITDDQLEPSHEQGLSYLTLFFNDRVQQFYKENENLLLYSAIFTEDTQEKYRLLQAWSLQGEKHPLYAIHALKEGLINEDVAYKYMIPFFDNIDYQTLIDFITLLQDSSVIDDAHDYFSNYEGKITIDSDGDMHSEFTVSYERGRPSKIEYDENQDGMLSWEMQNDYGAPITIEMYEEDMSIKFATWPYVHSVVDNSEGVNAYVYNLVENALALPVIDFMEDSTFQTILSLSFYTPLMSNETILSQEKLFDASYLIDAKTTEHEDSRVRYTLLNGVVKSALYTDNELPYAYAYFKDGKPLLRNVDNDRDGAFEVVEMFAQSSDAASISQPLDYIFVFDHISNGQYIQKVYFDIDNDGYDDYSEEYVENKYISSWDTNADGDWNVRLIIDELRSNQEVLYVHPISNEVKSVYIEGGIPVLSNGKNITKDPSFNFYWIGDSMGSSHAEKLITELSLHESPIAVSVTDLLWNSENDQFVRIVGMKSGDMYFGEVFYE